MNNWTDKELVDYLKEVRNYICETKGRIKWYDIRRDNIQKKILSTLIGEEKKVINEMIRRRNSR